MASTSAGECSDGVAKPLHLQRLQAAMQLDTFLNHVEHIFAINLSDGDETTDTDTDGFLQDVEQLSPKVVNGIVTTKQERRSDKARLYNFTRVKKGRKWLKNLLLSDSSDNEENGDEITETDLQVMLKMHILKKRHQGEFCVDKELKQYQYYSVGLLSNHDRFPEHQKSITGNKKKAKEKKLEKKMKAKLKKIKKREKKLQEVQELIIKQEQMDDAFLQLSPMAIKREDSPPMTEGPAPKSSKKKSGVVTEASLTAKRRKLWVALSKKEIPRAQKQKISAHKEVLTNCKKMAQACQKEIRKTAIQFQKSLKETPSRARRLTREMMLYWKRYDKVEKELRKRAEKEAQEQLKMDIELREAKRQQRKLNFLITQTELYAHFMSRKMGSAGHESLQEKILSHLEDEILPRGLIEDDYDCEEVKAQALRNAKNAYDTHQSKKRVFDGEKCFSNKQRENFGDDFRLTNPSLSTEQDRPQPYFFRGKLKVYQLKGMNWLANLYDQGINGILADEMGLGKTVQSIAFLAHIAESQDIWGPFLIIAPASTLHNWQQEFSRFLPKLKVLPYWGNTSDRKILRKFWNQKDLHTEDASFHVLITSYQLVVQDVKYFQRIKWQYMVLDEAQAIKSSSSVRWKILLGFNCRNRLLLTGTPIQNSMAELWALLHFIMPTLFDSHDEFNEWFSKDIENHAENKSTIDEKHLSRLHMILKPFMLRRIKKDVENELSDKIEILLYCHLTTRQKRLYEGLKQKISIEDLLHSSSTADANSQTQFATSSLMNLVMQFRKVCNHPELFERREVKLPFVHRPDVYVIPKLIFREGLLENSLPSRQHLLHGLFSIFHPVNVHRSLFDNGADYGNSYKTFSFSRFIELSPMELFVIMYKGLVERWRLICQERELAFLLFHRVEWQEPVPFTYLKPTAFHLRPLSTISLPSVETSQCLHDLVFTEYTGSVYTRATHVLHSVPETVEHRKMRARKIARANAGACLIGKALPGVVSLTAGTTSIVSPVATSVSAAWNVPLSASAPAAGVGNNVLGVPKSPTFLSKPILKIQSPPLHLEEPLAEFSHRKLPLQTLTCQLTKMPAFLTTVCPRVSSLPVDFHCSDRSAAYWRTASLLGTGRPGVLIWQHGTQEQAENHRLQKTLFYPSPAGGIYGTRPARGWSNIIIPDKETLVTDSGKLHVLDNLLARLKSQGHRVLIYSQMTRMIDLLEEYMWHRKHTYMRLDGSSKISERRDMVADFQSRSDIFIFLLSTRAGGLGINLTAADTVVFYDSDWNPTVDQQAMDRAHRLGQTKQVTVYRLICKGTIEERILQRAREKSEIQRMVISGGSFKPDTLKPKEVVSLLLDDDELEIKFRQRQAERRQLEDQLNNHDRRRKWDKVSGEKRARGGKRPRLEENVTIPASQETDSVISIDSIPPSPSPSEKSFSSAPIPQDETSNEGSLVVDDGTPLTPQGTTSSTASVAASVGQQVVPKKSSKSGRGTGRGRGRPKGSGKRGASRVRGGTMAAAEMAGAQAGATAAYAAYGYAVASTGPSNIPGTNLGRGHPMMRSTGVRMRGPINQGHRFPYKGSKKGTSPKVSAPTRNPVAQSPPTPSGAVGVRSTGMGFYLQSNSS